MDCATIANGIIAACKEITLKVPIVVRLEGTYVRCVVPIGEIECCCGYVCMCALHSLLSLSSSLSHLTPTFHSHSLSSFSLSHFYFSHSSSYLSLLSPSLSLTPLHLSLHLSSLHLYFSFLLHLSFLSQSLTPLHSFLPLPPSLPRYECNHC